MSAEHHVYRIWDDQGALVYIGATSRLQRRIAEHRATKTWAGCHPVLRVGERMHTWAAVEYPTRRAALDAEREAIAREHPELNTTRVAAQTAPRPVTPKESPMDLTPDYTLNEVAEALRMSPRWLRERIRVDGVEHQRKGHKITFTAEQVEKLRAAHTQAPVQQPVTTGRKRKTA